MNGTDERPGLGFVPSILAGLALLRRRAPGRAGATEAEQAPEGPGYETSDVHVGNTALVMAGLVVAALAAVGTMVWIRHDVSARQREALPRLTPQQTAKLTPPAPNLQAHPFADIDAERAAQARRLDGYAYTDAARGRARIPIDRAMGLIVGRTLDP